MKLYSGFSEKIVANFYYLLYNILMKKDVREPKQSRSIEKKKKIIEAGYKLFSEVGYYGTNTAEIAKYAGVSTGIVYGYFQDKRDILISALDIYVNKAFDPILKLFNKITAPLNYTEIIPQAIDLAIKIHKKNAKMHEALHSLASTDEAVNAEFISLEDQITLKIVDRLKSLGEELENLVEKIHFSINIVQSFSHEYIFDKHEYIDYFVMRDMVIKTILDLFKK